MPSSFYCWTEALNFGNLMHTHHVATVLRCGVSMIYPTLCCTTHGYIGYKSKGPRCDTYQAHSLTCVRVSLFEVRLLAGPQIHCSTVTWICCRGKHITMHYNGSLHAIGHLNCCMLDGVSDIRALTNGRTIHISSYDSQSCMSWIFIIIFASVGLYLSHKRHLLCLSPFKCQKAFTQALNAQTWIL